MKNETKVEQLQDMLTELDPPYESIEELRIGRLLDQYGIPFFYKQATIIYDQGKNEIWKPTFTLFSYGGLVIDYVPGIEQDQKDELLTTPLSIAVGLGNKEIIELLRKHGAKE